MSITVENGTLEVELEAGGAITVQGVAAPTIEVTEMVIGGEQVLNPAEILAQSAQPTTVQVTSQGNKGDKGDPGAPGSAGTDAFPPIVFVQSSPALPWHIVHGRGVNPSINLVRDDGVVIEGFGVEYPDANTVDIYAGLIKGTATLTF